MLLVALIVAILQGARAILSSGVMTNLPIAAVTGDGFTECWRTIYGAVSESYNNVFYFACTNSILMLACRPGGNSTLTVAAWVYRSDLMNCQCGSDPSTTCLLNGASWYNSDVYSIGYAAGGDTVTRSSCDTATTNPETRLCWHTSSGNIDGGCALRRVECTATAAHAELRSRHETHPLRCGSYRPSLSLPCTQYTAAPPAGRCGTNTELNGDTTWERIIYQRPLYSATPTRTVVR